MPQKKETRRYHHGDLRQALLAAAEEELTEKGVEGFSLRGCAKRAGVSHAAPAHHFKDAPALLTALAAAGFRRFVETQHRVQADVPPDPRAQMLAAGWGYVLFARENPALFKLIFTSDRTDFSHPELLQAAEAAYGDLVAGVEAIRAQSGGSDAPVIRDVAATWSIVHGLADLLSSGRLASLQGLDDIAQRAAIEEIISRVLPSGGTDHVPSETHRSTTRSGT